MNRPHQADRRSGMRMDIQTAERSIAGSWRKKWELEHAWCVQGMQSNLRGQKHRVLVQIPQGRKNQDMRLTMWGQDVKDLVLPSS